MVGHRALLARRIHLCAAAAGSAGLPTRTRCGPPGMTAQPGRPRDASMSLINELLTRPLDPGYAAAAERRRRDGRGEPMRPTGALVLVTALIIGLLFAVSATTLGARETERTTARTQLVAQIEARQERVDANSARVSELQIEVALAQE